MIELIEVILEHIEYYLTKYINAWVIILVVYFLFAAIQKAI